MFAARASGRPSRRLLEQPSLTLQEASLPKENSWPTALRTALRSCTEAAELLATGERCICRARWRPSPRLPGQTECAAPGGRRETGEVDPRFRRVASLGERVRWVRLQVGH